MKKEIMKFYSDKGIPISFMIAKRRHGTNPEQIEAAAVEIYNEIQNGLEISRQYLPKYIFHKAVGIDSEEYKKERIKIINYDKKVLLLAKRCKKQRIEIEKLKINPMADRYESLKFYTICLSVFIFLHFILKAFGITT